MANTVAHRWLPTTAHATSREADASDDPSGGTRRARRTAGRHGVAQGLHRSHPGRGPAGAMAATIVTSSPTASPTTTVRVSRAGEVLGISTPISFEQQPDAGGEADAEQDSEAAGDQTDHRPR